MIILFVSGELSASLKTVGTLLLLLLALPFNLLLVSLALLWKVLTIPFQRRISAENRQKVLITGGKMTKALQLARLFNHAGHEVTLVETHKYWLSGHRFSFAVKNFSTVPAPGKDTEGYCQGLLDIVKRSFSDLQAWIKKVTQGTDAIFQVNDPLPFLMVHHWQIPLLLVSNLVNLKSWVKIDFNIGKLVEIGGD